MQTWWRSWIFFKKIKLHVGKFIISSLSLSFLVLATIEEKLKEWIGIKEESEYLIVYSSVIIEARIISRITGNF